MSEELKTVQDLPEAPIVEEQEQKVQESNEQVEQQQEQAPQLSKEEINFASLRKAKESAEHERDMYYRKLQEIERSQQSAKQAKKKVDIGDDDLVEGKHLREIRSELQESKRELKEALNKANIKAQYPDFYSVVTPETIKQLEAAYPEVASSINSSPDFYNKASAAYTVIKKLGIYTGHDNTSNKNVVKKNTSKPRPISSVSPQQGDSPLTQANAFANGLTRELKQKLIREMNDARSKM